MGMIFVLIMSLGQGRTARVTASSVNHAKMLCLTVPLMEKNPVQVFTSRGPERIANCSVTTVEAIPAQLHIELLRRSLLHLEQLL